MTPWSREQASGLDRAAMDSVSALSSCVTLFKSQCLFEFLIFHLGNGVNDFHFTELQEVVHTMPGMYIASTKCIIAIINPISLKKLVCLF